MYEKYIANDKDSIMWFEPGTFPDVNGFPLDIILPVGFTKPPGAEVGSAHHVLNDHSYCC